MSDELDRLDKLAAEKVMGWELAGFPGRTYSGQGELCYWTDGSVAQTMGNIVAEGISWQPTRNIAQAWECLEKSDGQPQIMQTYFFDDPEHRKQWQCAITHLFHKNPEYVIAKAETAPEAIVKACLKAKGVTVSPVDEERECSHTWKIWGDDPKVRCYYCGIYRRQANGELI